MAAQLGFQFEEPGDAPESGAPRIYTVGELTRAVRGVLETAIGEVWVRGEISNYRRQASGHHYFTLKDDGSQLSCVLFAGAARGLRGLKLSDGLEIQAFGELTVYEARGQYQLVVRLVQEEGLGALQAKFEALKAKLAAEGVFDAGRKRPLPKFPARIGVVTSPTGAAIRDFLKVLHRRMPGVEVVIHPVRVQGRGAAVEIAAAVKDFSGAPENRLPEVDVIVVTRGGGSLEDLWEFNEEVVARAIAGSRIPVVSAVGHEIDFALSDFAADLRAPTPSAAAEMVVPDGVELMRSIHECVARMGRECTQYARRHRDRLLALERSVLHREPPRVIREFRQQVDRLAEGMQGILCDSLERMRHRLERSASVLAARHPGAAMRLARVRCLESAARMETVCRMAHRRARERRAALEQLLRTLSPEATLARGYTITSDAEGNILRSADDASDVLVTRFPDGSVRSRVENRSAED